MTVDCCMNISNMTEHEKLSAKNASINWDNPELHSNMLMHLIRRSIDWRLIAGRSQRRETTCQSTIIFPQHCWRIILYSGNSYKQQQNRLTTLKSMLIWASWHRKRTVRIQISASLSLLLSLQFPLIIFFHVLQSIASLCGIIRFLVHNLFLGLPLCLAPSASKVTHFLHPIIIILSLNMSPPLQSVSLDHVKW